MTSESSLVERFHRTLIESIRSDAPAYLRDTFTVAEIYQALVPYRTHRDRLGIEMNGDYEDALLRLLAGEGGYLVLESEPARKRIQRELQQRNPNTGIYREFAAVEVRLDPERVPPEGTPIPKRPDAQTTFGGFGDGVPSGTTAASSQNGSDEERRVASPVADVSSSKGPGAPTAEPEPTMPRGSGSESSCPECGKGLPDRENLQFCPHCGTNVRVVPCRGCGEILERDWEFCVACGTRSRG